MKNWGTLSWDNSVIKQEIDLVQRGSLDSWDDGATAIGMNNTPWK